jgi:hypothetical protein
MKRRDSEKGMALIITLMMLAVVTVMAVVFLSVSRRERTSVKTAEEQSNTRQMADMALTRAQSEVTAHMANAAENFIRVLNNTNLAHIAQANQILQRGKLHFDLLSSKNYINPAGFTPGSTNVANVNYARANGALLDRNSDDFLQNVANLQYDPRAPVFVGDEFRYYVDFNRNGRFETNGDVLVQDAQGRLYNADGTLSGGSGGVSYRATGDPEWIGVLERPDLPHSETNRFIGRFAYIILPTGRTLDANYIHNMSSYAPGNDSLAYSTGTNRYTRNQGVGSWEINMAAFLVDFATNIWLPKTTVTYEYDHTRAQGTAFKSAMGLLSYRYGGSRTNLLTPYQSLTNYNANGSLDLHWGRNNDLTGAFSDFVDYTGDGPFPQYDAWHVEKNPIRTGMLYDNDEENRFWFGNEHMAKTAEFSDVQKFFNITGPVGSDIGDFYTKFTNAVASSRDNNYDRYAYYRWLGQMGADSTPAIAGKIHLNFTNEPGTLSTNLRPWVFAGDTDGRFGGPATIVRPPAIAKDGNSIFQATPNGLTNFFLIAADAMLRASMVTNVFLEVVNGAVDFRTNYTIGGSYFVNPDVANISPYTNRQIANLPVRHDLSITNIQIYHELPVAERPTSRHRYVTNQEYTPALHRILQLTANIYDNMTNRGPSNLSNPEQEPYYPTVFRPLYAATGTNILITGWIPELDTVYARRTNIYAGPSITAPLQTALWLTKPQAFRRGNNITNFNIWGQPWVVGVKKGWPNFNEFSIESFIQITRKLEILKGVAGQVITTNALDLANHTRQIFVLGISNSFGIEAWNAYTNANKKNLQIHTEVQSEVGLERVFTNGNVPVISSIYANTPIAASMRGGMTLITNWNGRRNDRVDLAFSKAPNGTNINNVFNNSDFRVPLHTSWTALPDSLFVAPPTATPDFPGAFYPGPFNLPVPAGDLFQPITQVPQLRLVITNRVRYALLDTVENRVIDFVSLDNVITRVDLSEALGGTNASNLAFGAGFNPALLWDNSLVTNHPGFTRGMLAQLLVSNGDIPVSKDDWANYTSTAPLTNEVDVFQQFLSMLTDNNNLRRDRARQAPFSPTRRFSMLTLFQANDPLVHYTYQDLRDPYQTSKPSVVPPGSARRNNELGFANDTRWKMRNDARFHNAAFQDPGIGNHGDDWQFPIAKLDNQNTANVYGIPNFQYRYPNIGELGKIHRGTPWQTVYLKSAVAPNQPTQNQPPGTISQWAEWAGSYGTHPTNDWKLVGLFTTAITENAARGLLSVNQTNMAAWSAVLSGLSVITNSVEDAVVQANPLVPARFGVPPVASPGAPNRDIFIEPGSIQVSNIVRGINAYRASRPLGVFANLGEILGTPQLSSASPFLNLGQYQHLGMFTDEAFEAIPQKILSLLKNDEPRFTVYCFGQTLRPAPRSFATTSQFYNLCVNYQVTGEYATKAVFRVEGELKNPANPIRTVVEKFEPLAPYE